ncbi:MULTISPECIES: MMPL family transporter [Streptomyces]|uniref:Putative integral membrane protein n=1 Tax=Streptomyces scabiei (strain 87.22) TaxID=680198 RepID=C9ZCE4_STRSW|nr:MULTISPECIES: MMPL family transporter [Streptomyces]KFG08228.1 membrane protein [Streptomyces scabiei]MBP5893887.1 MMPL family transporter [Streptomyces sp. LBUM 1481]MBP5917098.1 MMPL family transporter [Streptomyces sp. LBUM 1486]MBP5924140.1 MMPL family transporter [Streptomyces sp. LBUM 1483]MDX2575665.1 MMPL family transporter [Streptomyces scabiei]
MFSALGSALHRRRIVLLLLTLLVTALATVYGGTVEEKLSNGLSDYDDPGGGNVAAREIIERATGIDPQQGHLLLVRTDERLAEDTAPPKAVTAAAELLRSRPEVEQVLDYTSPDGAALISRDGRSTVVVGATGSMTDQESARAVEALQKAIDDDPTLRDRTWLGGATPGHVQVAEVSSTDLGQAELLATPVILVVLFVVFRGLVAALVPLLGGIVSLLLTMAGLRVATEFMNVSTGATSLAFALGLGLSIDFGLLLVSRYREELAEHGPGAEAVRRTVATAGRTVLFSALTVAAALAALIAFPQPYLRSMGLAGVITVVSAALFALLGLPPLLALLGKRINSLAPRRWQRTAGAARATEGRWYRVAQAVMRRPAVFALAATAVLLLIASPLLGVRFTGVDPTLLPEETSAGKVAAVLDEDYDARATSPLQIVLETDGAPDTARLADYTERIGAVPGVRSVGTPVELGDRYWEIDAVLAEDPLTDSSKDAVGAVQDLAAPYPARYTGRTADFLAQRQSIADALPLAGGILVVVTLLLLFAFSGSVVLPLKALLMNLLSTGAAFGFLVWVFQDGNLGFAPQTGLEATTPVLVFALAFGLSTDYNVFLLSRIKEARAQGLDNREAVAQGLSRTGGIVTSAAVLFCIPVGALAMSRLVFIQELGLGAAFAVLIDATVVRAFLVPSLMALLGAANWWAPAPLRALHRALRLDRMEHTEAPEPAPAPAPDRTSAPVG